MEEILKSLDEAHGLTYVLKEYSDVEEIYCATFLVKRIFDILDLSYVKLERLKNKKDQPEG